MLNLAGTDLEADDQTIYIDFISPWLVFELTTLVVIIYGADVVEWSSALDIRLQ
jgi:hypothetical protein